MCCVAGVASEEAGEKWRAGDAAKVGLGSFDFHPGLLQCKTFPSCATGFRRFTVHMNAAAYEPQARPRACSKSKLVECSMAFTFVF